MSIFQPAPEPKSALGYHRILSPTAGVRVSPLCLGAMNFGDAWEQMMGKCDKKTTFEILDFFYEQGGNFIDTCVPCELCWKHIPTDASTEPTTIRMSRASNGSVNGWKSVVTVMKWSLLLNSPRASGARTARKKWHSRTSKGTTPRACMYRSMLA